MQLVTAYVCLDVCAYMDGECTDVHVSGWMCGCENVRTHMHILIKKHARNFQMKEGSDCSASSVVLFIVNVK